MRDLLHDNFEIIALPEGEKITEPGFYNISLERHHSQPCEGPSVTSGILRKMELETPADVWETHQLNPDRTERSETDALRLGRVMASYVENGPDGVEEFVRVLPSKPKSLPVPEMLKLAKDGHVFPKAPPNRPNADQVQKYIEGTATPAAKRQVEYWMEVDNDPRDKVNETEWEMICNMGKALAANPMACAVMEGVPEISMAWRDEQTGIWCLARPDTVSFSGAISDYKKFSGQGRPISDRMIDSKIEQFGYYMQMAFACEGFRQLTGQEPSSVGLVFQSDKAPYHVVLREVDEECISIGRFQNDRALKRFAECLQSGDWPDAGEVPGTYRMSEWLYKRLTEEMQTAGVAQC